MNSRTIRILGLVGGFVLAGVLAGAGIAFVAKTDVTFTSVIQEGNTLHLTFIVAFALAASIAVYGLIGWIQEKRQNRTRLKRFAGIKQLVEQERRSHKAAIGVWEQKQKIWEEDRRKLEEKREEAVNSVRAQRSGLENEIARMKKELNRHFAVLKQSETLERKLKESQQQQEESRQAWKREREELIRTGEDISEHAEDRLRDSQKSCQEQQEAWNRERGELQRRYEKVEQEAAELKRTSDELRREREEQAALVSVLKAKIEEFKQDTAQRKEQVAEARRDRLAFLAKVSGSLLSPVARIAHLARNYPDTANPVIVEITSLAQSFVRSLEDVLDLAKLEAGSYRLVTTEVALEKILSRVIATHRPLAAAREINLTWDQADNECGSIAIDERIVERCVSSLLDNAVKFTPRAGRVDVRAAIEERQGKATAVIEVRDSGIGIPHDKQEEIFEPFVCRVQRRSELAEGGAGVGLSLVRAYVALHGGDVAVKSTPGEGSVFTVAFPARSQEAWRRSETPQNAIEPQA